MSNIPIELFSAFNEIEYYDEPRELPTHAKGDGLGFGLRR